METKYKETPIGRIPDDWKLVELGDENVAKLIMGQSPPSSTYNDDGIGVPFLQGNAEFTDTYPTPIISCSQPKKISEKNDILLSVRAPVGDVNIAPYKLCIGRGLAAIRPNRDRLEHLFLFYVLKFRKRKFESLSMGSTFKAIRKEEVEKFQIPLPPLPEQRRIAEVLGTVDSAIQKVGGAIERTERFKRGLMQKLLTRGIGHERFKETKVGRIPEEWEVAKLGEISNSYAGGTPLRADKNQYNGNIPWVKSGEINQGYIYDTEEKITEEGLENSSAKKVPKNTVLVAMYGATAGKVGILKIEGTTNQAVLAIINKNDNFEYEFMYFLLSSKTQNFIATTQGTGQPNLSKKLVDNLKIPLPPLPEQRRIAEILSTVDKKLELERRRKEKLERIKKGLMNELLTGRKRVNRTEIS